MTCKGNFSTCDICNAANEMLSEHSKKYSLAQRELVMKWRKLHLVQQAKERESLAYRKVLHKIEGQLPYA